MCPLGLFLPVGHQLYRTSLLCFMSVLRLQLAELGAVAPNEN